MDKKVRIEIILGDPAHPELHVIGQVDEEIVDQTLKFFGLRYTPPATVAPYKPIRVNCANEHTCLDWPGKCESCAQNKMEHLFEEKTEVST